MNLISSQPPRFPTLSRGTRALTAAPFALAAVLCIGSLLVGCEPATKPQPSDEVNVDGERVMLPENALQRKSLTLEPVTVRTSNISHLTGRLVWDDEVTVRVYSPVGGRVLAVDADLGQRVDRNAILARISSPDFAQAQADVSKAAADLILAGRNLNRARDLQQHGAAAQKDVELTEDAFAAARAESERATARLTLYGGTTEVLDGLFPLRAPIAGTVVERNVSPGQEVRPDQMLGNVPQVFEPLLTLSDPTKLWVVVDATETDMASLRIGQQIHIHATPYGNREFAGVIDVIGDTLEPTTRTVKVRGTIPNPDRLLKAEMYVTVDIIQTVPPTAEVPAKAMFLKDNKAYVFVEASGGFCRQEIKTGSEVDGKIAVLEGVKPDQRVVTEGCLLLETLLESKTSP
jgi:cobalt-zinc-cadmium efflux system membrane fusion protein